MWNWSDQEAQRMIDQYPEVGEDLALRVYTSRLLGRDPRLVLHGGGNTSVKTTHKDELGREVSVLCVKGSGWDLSNIEPPGLPAVCLEPLQDFRQLDAMSDEAMVNGVRRFLLDTSAPNPSVETLLHAFLPHKYVDHTHADAVLALADQPNAEALCRDVFGDSMGIVPYIMPGFALAKAAAEAYEANPDVTGLVLINHGIFSFGANARESYERMMAGVALAEAAIAERQRVTIAMTTPAKHPVDTRHVRCLRILRGLLSKHPEGIGPQVLHIRNSAQIEAFLAHENLASLASRGTATPDHVIRTKRTPLILPQARFDDYQGFKRRASQALDAYVQDYKTYFQTQVRQKGVDKKPLHPLPPVMLIPGIGVVTAGQSRKAATVAADIYEHTVDVIFKAEAVGRYTPLSQDHLFDMEYWSLEQAKLGKRKPLPLAGQVAVITGAAGGIGAATAAAFAADGCNVILTDMDVTRLEQTVSEIRQNQSVAVIAYGADLTDEAQVKAMFDHAVLELGGVDIVVSNAGRAYTGPIEDSTGHLRASLDVNLMSHQYISAAALRVMRDQGSGGCLLYNASKSAFNPGAGFGAYTIPKAALIALMKQYAVEGAPHGIRAMAINADRIRTKLLDEDQVAARARARGLDTDAYFRSNMLGCEVLASDVAAAFLQLVYANKTTGTVFTVDGGNIAAAPR